MNDSYEAMINTKRETRGFENWPDRQCGEVWKNQNTNLEGVLRMEAFGVHKKLNVDLHENISRNRTNLAFRLYISRCHKIVGGSNDKDEPLSVRECGCLFKYSYEKGKIHYSGYIELGKFIAQKKTDKVEVLMFPNMDKQTKNPSPVYRFYTTKRLGFYKQI